MTDKEIEQDDKIQNYKIASITAFDDEQTRNNLKNSGVTTILSKPQWKSQILNFLKL